MKSLLVTSLLFIALLCTVIVNAFFVNHVTDQMEQMIINLPDLDNENLLTSGKRLCAYWEQNADWLALSIGYNVIERVNEQAALLLCCAESKDLYGYQAARALLLDAVGDVRRAEQFSIGNLL